VAAIVSKGSLARQALDQVDAVIAQEGGSWVSYYVRGMNHLHWPRALRHSDDAAVDLARCVEMQEETGSPAGQPYYVRTHIALGDAHAKAKQFQDARRAWKLGLSLFPDSVDLQQRLAMKTDGEVLKYVVNHRSLEQPVDTSLAFLDGKP
ncbi:MAG: tetratricopeptide repeat protein, partial [Planctomycetes bacterium]|nr:tetratricopeptide repeat protein [Planctomycetota bacterium]